MQAGLTVTKTLRTRPPFAHRELLAFLALRAVPGVEEVTDGTYRRTLRLPGGAAVISVTPRASSVRVEARVSDDTDVPHALEAARRIFDLDADAPRIDAALASDPVMQALVAARPGLRAPGTADGAELLVRAITGQQVSVVGARTTLGKIVAAHGEQISETAWLFPSSEQLAAADAAALGMPHARGRAIVVSAAACAEGLSLQAGADLAATRDSCLPCPASGHGPRTTSQCVRWATATRISRRISVSAMRWRASATATPSAGGHSAATQCTISGRPKPNTSDFCPHADTASPLSIYCSWGKLRDKRGPDPRGPVLTATK